MRAAAILMQRELALAWGRGGGALLALGFYAGVVTLLPLAVGQDQGRLAAVSVGVSWIGLALASLLSLDRLFERDFEDGALDLLVLGPLPLEAVCTIKAAAQWLATGAPLALAAPLGAISLGAPPALAALIVVTAALGGVAFAFVGAAGAALALASRRGGVLIAVMVLPLLIPPVIFGGTALDHALAGLPFTADLALLGAYAAGAVALTPFAMAGACRNALS